MADKPAHKTLFQKYGEEVRGAICCFNAKWQTLQEVLSRLLEVQSDIRASMGCWGLTEGEEALLVELDDKIIEFLKGHDPENVP